MPQVDLECFGRLILQLLAHDLSIKYPMTQQQEEKVAGRHPQLLQLAKDLCSGTCIAAKHCVATLDGLSSDGLPSSTSATDQRKERGDSKGESQASEHPSQEDQKQLTLAIFHQMQLDGFVSPSSGGGTPLTPSDCRTQSAPTQWAIQHGLESCRKASVILSNMDDVCNLRVDLPKWIEIVRHSNYASQLSAEHCKKLFQLMTLNDNASALISGPRLACAFAWLGPHDLTASQAIPASLAIDFVYHCVMANAQIRARFGGLVSRKQLDERQAIARRDGAKLEPMFRFSESRVLSVNGQTLHLHRNLVLTNFEDAEFPHRLLFAYDPTSKRVVEASDAQRRFYYAATAATA